MLIFPIFKKYIVGRGDFTKSDFKKNQISKLAFNF